MQVKEIMTHDVCCCCEDDDIHAAACTPEFFLFDKERKLVYRGQMDYNRPGDDIPVTGVDPIRAMDSVLAGRDVSGDQKPSIGCNIKWKQENEPEYVRR